MEHRLSNVNVESRTATCAACGPVTINSRGQGRFRCSRLTRERTKKRYGNENSVRRRWRKHKGDRCEECNFVPLHTAQLDVHHIDHNKKNNDPSNLMTLCANCHRFKHT